MSTTAWIAIDGFTKFYLSPPVFRFGPGNYTIGISSLSTADGYIIESRWRVFPSVQVEAKDDSMIWIDLPMTFNFTTGLYEATIPGQPEDTLVKYKITAYDNDENQAVNDNRGNYYTFHVIQNYQLPITSTEGGTTDPAPGTHTYVNGTVVEVTAIPNVNYVLYCWELDGENVGSVNPIEVMMDSDHMLHAVFRLLTYSLTISATAGGTTAPAPGTYTYVNGTVVSVTAIPDVNYRFEYWLLDGINVGSNNPIEILMDSNHSLQAVFAQVTYDLVVHVVNERGGSLLNAVVNLSWLNGTKIASLATNSTGYVVFENLPSTTYHVKASLEGYREKSVEITLTSEDQTETIILQSIPFIETPAGTAAMVGVAVAGIVAAVVALVKKGIIRR
jgi:hypothetical protein